MMSKKKWIIGTVALLLVGGGVTALVVAPTTPMTQQEILKEHEQTYGKAPEMPVGEVLQEQLSEATAADDWEKEELLKQQIVFAEHAPSPMPAGHESFVSAGKEP